MLLDSLPAEAVDAFAAAAGLGAPPGLLSAEMRHLGGELARPRPGNGALAAIGARYAFSAAGSTPVPGLVAPVMARVDAVKRALAPWAARQMYLNFAETPRPAGSFWSEQAYRRLRQIKAAVDPRDLIRSNHPIPPAGA
jgi:hypothetical protein